MKLTINISDSLRETQFETPLHQNEWTEEVFDKLNELVAALRACQATPHSTDPIIYESKPPLEEEHGEGRESGYAGMP